MPPPTQCANTTIDWSVTGGQPPIEITFIPTGALHPEVRRIFDRVINDNSTSLSFQLNYPGNSTFVAVLSDIHGFGSLGTTPVITVQSSQDDSCISTVQSAPEFIFFIEPPVPTECSQMSITFNRTATSAAHPPVDIFAVLPGGESFEIAQGNPQNMTFEWTPRLTEGTEVLLIAGDANGLGTGGSSDILTVQPGNSTACLPVTTTVLPTITSTQSTNTSISTPGDPGPATGGIPNKSSANILSPTQWSNLLRVAVLSLFLL